MKKIILSIIYIFFLGIVFTACEDNRMDGMVDEKVYILKDDSDDNEAHVVAIDHRDFGDYLMTVCKSGMRTKDAKIAISMNEEFLAAYNEKYQTDYKLLPDYCYELSDLEGYIPAKGLSFQINIAFNGADIKDLQSIGTRKYVLPVQLTATGVSTDSISSQYLIVPVLE